MNRTKKMYKVLVLVAGLIALTACEANIEPEKPETIEGPIMLSMEGFDAQTSTKASVSGTSVVWESGDKVTLNGTEYTVTVDGDKAYVNASGITAGQPVYGYSGCSVSSDGFSTTPRVTIQAGYTCSFNEETGRQVIALPMAAYSASASNTITFKHLTAAVEVTVWNATASNLYIDAVTVTAKNSSLNGYLDLDFEAANFGIISKTDGATANRSVTVYFPTSSPMVIEPGEAKAKSIQVPILPIEDNEELTIKVTSHNADITGVPVSGLTYSSGMSYPEPVAGLTHVFNYKASSVALGRNKMLRAKVKMSPQSANVTSKGTFSVSDTKAVYFSKGNLQAKATNVTTTSADWKWRFADNQYDYIGTDGNSKITASAPWISEAKTVDLFGWVSESHSDSFNGVAINGITASTNNADYGLYKSLKTDWGKLVSEGFPKDWYTLGKPEWEYLLYTRGSTGHLSTLTQEGCDPVGASFFKATVASVCGLVLIPDDFTWPDELVMPEGFVKKREYSRRLNNIGYDYDYYISDLEWPFLEKAGCVFLPAAGRRKGSVVIDDSRNSNPSDNAPYGYYWTSSYGSGDTYPYRLYFYKTGMYIQYRAGEDGERYVGMSVRVVYPATSDE